MVTVGLFVILLVALVLPAVAFSPIGRPTFTSEVSPRYTVSGRVVLSTVDQDVQRLFRFFNDVEGEVGIEPAPSAIEAKGIVRVELPPNDGAIAPREQTSSSDLVLERIHQFGAMPIAALTMENLTGLRDQQLEIGGIGSGLLVGTMKVLGVTQDLELPVKITRFNKMVYILEPEKGLSYSMATLGISEEVAYLIDADVYSMDDKLRLYFKLVLEPANN